MVFSVVWAVLLLAAGSAVARPVQLSLAFRSAGAASGVATNSRYAFVMTTGGGPDLGTLSDGRTRERRLLVQPGCSNVPPGPVAGPWLVFECGLGASSPAPELYSLGAGSWRTVAPQLQGPCTVDSCATPVAAGSSWLEYVVSDCPQGEHCIAHNEFENIDSGQLLADPTGGRTIADLGSPALAQPLCAPLRVPTAFALFSGEVPGSLTMDGQFAIAQGTDANGTPRTYLERCGSKLHRLLVKGPYPGGTPPIAWNAHTVIWQSGPGRLAGVFLPSLRRFALAVSHTLPSAECSRPDLRTCFSELALTRRTLYLLSADGTLWTSHSPSAPRANHPRAKNPR